MSEIKIKMLTTVRPDTIMGWLPIQNKLNICAYAGESYEAESNAHGAISVAIDGNRLGIKPEEFEFIEAPSWVLDKHIEYYNSKKAKLLEDMELFSYMERFICNEINRLQKLKGNVQILKETCESK